MISKLSKKERNELISTTLIDQPRNLLLKDFTYIDDLGQLEYMLKMVNGDVVIKTNPLINLNEPFVIKSVLYVLKNTKNTLCKLSLLINNEIPSYVLKFNDEDKTWINSISTNLNPDNQEAGINVLSKFKYFSKLICTSRSGFQLVKLTSSFEHIKNLELVEVFTFNSYH